MPGPLCGGPGSTAAVGLVAWLVAMWLPALCRGWAGGRRGLEGGRSQLGSEPDVAGAPVSGLPLLVLTIAARAGDGGLQGQTGFPGPCWGNATFPEQDAPPSLRPRLSSCPFFLSSWPLGCPWGHVLYRTLPPMLMETSQGLWCSWRQLGGLGSLGEVVKWSGG